MLRRAFSLLTCVSVLFACSDETLLPRKAGERRPLTSTCGVMDSTRCLLPWPSNGFAERSATDTGLLLALEADAFEYVEDPSSLNLADGFSRVTPIMTGFPGRIAPGSVGDGLEGSLRLINAQPDSGRFGEVEALRLQVYRTRDGESFLLGFPRRRLEAGSDYVVVVLDELETEDGSELAPERTTLVALGLVSPSSEDEERLVAYFAPIRELLRDKGIPFERVLRVWDFTTRSEADPLRRVQAMRAAAIGALENGEVSLVIDKVEQGQGDIALIVEARLSGLPGFRTKEGDLVFADRYTPTRVGPHDTPIRLVLPRGTGDYDVALYGHGTGGSFRDDAFDSDMAAAGILKAGVHFHGWDEEVILTLGSLVQMLKGTSRSSAGLMQALADLAAIQRAVPTLVADALAQAEVGGVTNPSPGRRPRAVPPVWTGGSLGGTMGMVHASADPDLRHAVLNVPGAAWTHFIPGSDIYEMMKTIMRDNFGGEADMMLAIAMSQNNWDDVDGAVWAGAAGLERPIALLQQSMGDPILPGPGTEMAAAVLDAVHVGPPLEQILDLPVRNEAVGRSAITQFKVPQGSVFEVHGFAARNTPAGRAARDQIFGFLQSSLAGTSRIDFPQGCVESGREQTCDFSQP